MSTVKFDNMSTNRIEILGQTTIKCLLFIYEYKFIGFDNQPNILASVWSWVTPKYDRTFSFQPIIIRAVES